MTRILRRIWMDDEKRFLATLLIGAALLLAACACACLTSQSEAGMSDEEARLLDDMGGRIATADGVEEVLPEDKVLHYGRYVLVDCEDGRLLAFRTADIEGIDFSL